MRSSGQTLRILRAHIQISIHTLSFSINAQEQDKKQDTIPSNSFFFIYITKKYNHQHFMGTFCIIRAIHKPQGSNENRCAQYQRITCCPLKNHRIISFAGGKGQKQKCSGSQRNRLFSYYKSRQKDFSNYIKIYNNHVNNKRCTK